MKNATTSLSLSFMTLVLLSGTAMAAVTDLQAQTGWAISRVASASKGSYCTMAQKYNDGTVMTLARNSEGEYSVAFDFQADKFSVGKAMPISLRAGGQPATTFEITPQSENAVIIGLGADQGFIDALKSSGKVTMDVQDQSYTFNTAKFADAESELGSCISSMKSQLREAKAAASASEPAAGEAQQAEAQEKSAISAATASTAPAAQAMATAAGKAALSAEDLAAAPVETSAVSTQMVGSDVAAENEQLKESLAEARRSYENKMSASSGPAIPELQEKIRVLDLENAKLKDQLDQASNKSGGKQEVEKLKADLAAMQEQNKVLQSTLAEAQTSKANAEQSAQTLTVSKKEVEALKAENQTLKNQLQMNPAPDQVKTLQQQVRDLEVRNAELRDLAEAQTQADVSKGAAADTGDEGLRSQIRDLKAQISLIETENNTLKDQLSGLQKDAEGKQLKMAGGNWDLEQATRRYQESQREIRRLGALLEQDRIKCQEEKKEIEYMLFDPEVAKPAQIAMLGSLEDQIAAKDLKIAELEKAIGNAPSPEQQQAAKENADAMAQVQAQVQAQEKSKFELEQKLADRDQKIADLEAALKSAKVQPASGDARGPVQTAENLLNAEVKVATPSQAQQAPVAIVPAEISTQQAPAQQTAAIEKMPLEASQLQPQDMPMQQQAASGFQSSQDFDNLLRGAGIALRNGVKSVNGAAQDYKAYSWQTESLYGSAEQRSMKNRQGFETAVEQYLNRAKSRCTGDFAAVKADVNLSSAEAADGYEIACVSGQSGSSASLLFTLKDGVMTTIAHEGRAEAMDIAMDTRDRIAAGISSN